MFYSQINADQVVSVYVLLRFLERLSIIGHLKAHTVAAYANLDANSMSDLSMYGIVKDSYSSEKGSMDAQINFEKAFGRISRPGLRGTD